MDNTQLAEQILRFYAKKRIELECSERGEQLNEDQFETSFQTMLASDQGKGILAKIIKSAEDAE